MLKIELRGVVGNEQKIPLVGRIMNDTHNFSMDVKAVSTVKDECEVKKGQNLVNIVFESPPKIQSSHSMIAGNSFLTVFARSIVGEVLDSF